MRAADEKLIIKGLGPYIAARKLDYCTQEAVLSQRAAKCGLHNSVNLNVCSPELDLRC